MDPGRVLVGWAALTLALLSLLWVVQRRAVNRSGATLCGSCGYNLQGLSGHTCPECGGDLRRRDGILRPGWRRSTETLARLVQWTILLPLAGLIVSGLVGMLVERREARRGVYLAAPRDQHSSVIIEAKGEGYSVGYSRPVKMDRVTVELRGFSSPPVSVEVDAATWTYREAGASGGGPPRPLDREEVEGWLVRAGLDGAPSERRAEAEELVSLIRSAAADGEWHPTPVQFRVRRSETSPPTRIPDPWFRIAAAGLWLVLWIIGVVWILKRRVTSRRLP